MRKKNPTKVTASRVMKIFEKHLRRMACYLGMVLEKIGPPKEKTGGTASLKKFRGGEVIDTYIKRKK